VKSQGGKSFANSTYAFYKCCLKERRNKPANKYSSEISPTRCNNFVLFSAMALLYMFRVTISPIIRSTYAVYGHR